MGPWHIVIAIAISLGKFPISWHQLSIVFLAPPVNFTCTSPFLTNDKFRNDGCQVDLGNGTLEKCSHFSYDRSIFRESIITQVSNKLSPLFCQIISLEYEKKSTKNISNSLNRRFPKHILFSNFQIPLWTWTKREISQFFPAYVNAVSNQFWAESKILFLECNT